MKKKILITGGAGFLGVAWSQYAQSAYDVHVTVNKNKHVETGCTSHQINLVNTQSVNDLIQTIRPDIIVNTAGLTNVDHCENNRELAHELNVTITKNLALAAKFINAQFVHISTDHLFDGKKKIFSETDEVRPVNVYGETKLAGERECLKINPEALVVRTNFFGKSHSSKKSFSDWLYAELSQGNKISMYTDVFYTPIYATNLIRYVHITLDKRLNGVINIAGVDRLSKFEFGYQFAKYFNLDTTLIQAISVDQIKGRVRRPKEMSLDVTKFIQLTGTKVDSLSQSFKQLMEENGGKYD
jgi:dTDP-4-dehydrorhamnose reductase